MTRERTRIDLDTYAEVMANLQHFPADKKDEVLARLGIRPRVWEAASEKWQRARDDAQERSRTAIGTRFAHVVVATLAKLDAQRPSLESLGPLPGPDTTPGAQLAPAATCESEVPTFLLAAHARVHGAAPVAVSVASSAATDLRGTADSDMRAIMAALARGPLPFARPEAQSPPPPRKPPRRSTSPCSRSKRTRTSPGPLRAVSRATRCSRGTT